MLLFLLFWYGSGILSLLWARKTEGPLPAFIWAMGLCFGPSHALGYGLYRLRRAQWWRRV